MLYTILHKETDVCYDIAVPKKLYSPVPSCEERWNSNGVFMKFV